MINSSSTDDYGAGRGGAGRGGFGRGGAAAGFGRGGGGAGSYGNGGGYGNGGRYARYEGTGANSTPMRTPAKMSPFTVETPPNESAESGAGSSKANGEKGKTEVRYHRFILFYYYYSTSTDGVSPNVLGQLLAKGKESQIDTCRDRRLFIAEKGQEVRQGKEDQERQGGRCGGERRRRGGREKEEQG